MPVRTNKPEQLVHAPDTMHGKNPARWHVPYGCVTNPAKFNRNGLAKLHHIYTKPILVKMFNKLFDMLLRTPVPTNIRICDNQQSDHAHYYPPPWQITNRLLKKSRISER